jgi:hypothetical protein
MTQENTTQETGQEHRQEGGQELGRVERPAAEQYRGKRRLLLVPLIYGPPPVAEAGGEGSEESSEESQGQVILERYWEQAQTQVNALSAGLGGLDRIYHESLFEGGEAGLAYLQMADRRSHGLIQAKFQAGATLEATESLDLLTETLDLQRCLMVPFTSEKVASRIQEWFAEGTRSRYEYIAQQIDQTLQADETGLLLINERHQVQFPTDIEVFYIAPPALDEFRRWVQNWAARQRRAEEAVYAEDDSEDDEEVGG